MCVQAASSALSIFGGTGAKPIFSNASAAAAFGVIFAESALQQLLHRMHFVVAGVALQRLLPGPGDPLIGRALAFAQNAGRKDARSLHIRRIIEQHERLLRNVRAGSLGRTCLAARTHRTRSAMDAGNVRCRQMYMPRRYWLSPWSAT